MPDPTPAPGQPAPGSGVPAPSPGASAPDAGPPVCLTDFEALAKERVPRQAWDYIAGGSGAEGTLEANRVALNQVGLLPRMLAGVATPDITARLLGDAGTMPGAASSMPVAVAPMAYQRLAHPDGELAVAAAARAAGAPFVASTLSSYPIEEIAAVGGEVWFQLYWQRERHVVEGLVARAQQAGCRALMVTVDVPILARRPRDLRNAFALPADVTAANLAADVATVATADAVADFASDAAATQPAEQPLDQLHVAAPGASALADHTKEAFKPGLSWRDLEWLRGQTDLPLVVKGILDPDDARLAVDVGAAAVVVSNHGGRQLDGAAPSVTALPAVVEAVAGRCQVLMDSGVRSGVDVLRALALGASGVLLGRPVLWALAVGGRRGVEAALSLLEAELLDVFALAGCADVAAASRLRTVHLGEAR